MRIPSNAVPGVASGGVDAYYGLPAVIALGELGS
jgi:hypothetical protein